jgi:uncharacterized OB-fold protein
LQNVSDKSVNSKAAQQRLKVRRVIPIPEPDEVTKPYWDAARHHQLVVAKCASCHTFRHPPTPDCSACGGTNINWTPLSGDGHVYSFIIDRRLMVPGFDEPYVLATVIPDEAPSDALRIVANIKECDIAAVYIGMPVEVFFEERGGVTLPQFRPRRSLATTSEPAN